MHKGNSHRARFGVQVGRELAQGVDPAADAMLRFQDHHVMPCRVSS